MLRRAAQMIGQSLALPLKRPALLLPVLVWQGVVAVLALFFNLAVSTRPAFFAVGFIGELSAVKLFLVLAAYPLTLLWQGVLLRAAVLDKKSSISGVFKEATNYLFSFFKCGAYLLFFMVIVLFIPKAAINMIRHPLGQFMQIGIASVCVMVFSTWQGVFFLDENPSAEKCVDKTLMLIKKRWLWLIVPSAFLALVQLLHPFLISYTNTGGVRVGQFFLVSQVSNNPVLVVLFLAINVLALVFVKQFFFLMTASELVTPTDVSLPIQRQAVQ